MAESHSAVPVIDGVITITTDKWGIPHVRAETARDAFVGQGYAQARVRLFQIDLWRRRGLGLLAEVLGPEYVPLDVAARTFLARGDTATEFAAYPARDRERIRSFVQGINARVDEVLADVELLPPEFRTLGFRPSRWEADDILRIRIHGLSANAEEEVVRTQTLARFGPGVEALRKLVDPAVHFGGAPLPDVFDDDLLDLYRLAHAPVTFSGAGAIAPGAPPPAPPDGSNNWAIAGRRTASGRPIVANDPHRIMTFPSLRMLIHLACPEFDVIGMQEPYLPGVVAGHNGHVAFGITIAPADLEDLYFYDLHATDDELYLGPEGWTPIAWIAESIPVAGGEAVVSDLPFAVHGPILRIDRERRVVVAIRAAWLDPGMTPYLASLGLIDAATVDEYLADLRGWGSPVLNHVVADTGGHIAWQVAGRVPNRPNWAGLLPVPGDGSHEWAGMRTAVDLPRRIDPPEGWVRSANQNNLAEDPGWHGTPQSHEWYSGYRARRLAARLEEIDDWTILSSAALQNDYVVEPAAELMSYLADPFTDPAAEFARREILGWDQRMTIDSTAAAIFDRWLYRILPINIRREASRRTAPPGLADAAADLLVDERLLTLGDPRSEVRLLAESLGWTPSDSFVSTARMVEATLGETVRSLRDELGTNPASWRWGDIHVSRLVHPLHGIETLAAEWTDTGSHPKAGSSDTIGVAFGAAGVQTLGAATRVVIDVGDWDASLCINSPGQDGALDSPHARDLYDTWLADGYVPLLYSRDRIDEHAESVHRLTPTPRGTTHESS
jgi:penicillin amidase